MLAGAGGQHGWQDLIRSIFANGLWRRLRRTGCRGGRRRRALASGVSTAIRWVQRFRETGSVAPGQMGGHKPKKRSAGEHRDWLLERLPERDFTLRGLVAELAERGLKVDYRTVWDFVHAEKLSFKKNADRRPSRTVPTSRAGGRSGRSIRAGSIRRAWCSSTRPGPRPTWRRCAAGHRAASGSRPRCRTATGRP